MNYDFKWSDDLSTISCGPEKFDVSKELLKGKDVLEFLTENMNSALYTRFLCASVLGVTKDLDTRNSSLLKKYVKQAHAATGLKNMELGDVMDCCYGSMMQTDSNDPSTYEPRGFCVSDYTVGQARVVAYAYSVTVIIPGRQHSMSLKAFEPEETEGAAIETNIITRILLWHCGIDASAAPAASGTVDYVLKELNGMGLSCTEDQVSTALDKLGLSTATPEQCLRCLPHIVDAI